MTTIETPVVLAGGTKISWSHFTFNSWWGCVRVSPACKSCYAETFSHRLGMDLWGKHADRRFFGDGHWAEPLKWNRKAVRDGVRYRVFCASMADVFEDYVVTDPTNLGAKATRARMDEARQRLWDLIEATPHLDWMLLTKRPENIAGMLPSRWSGTNPLPPNLWMGVTAEDQKRADERLPHLRAIDAIVRFVSYEPAVGPVDFDLTGIDLVIAGGESGHGARPAHPDWFRAARDQCVAAGTAFHFKQYGEWAPAEQVPDAPASRLARAVAWPDEQAMVPVGTKAAGRELDGRTWDEMPERRGSAA